MNWAEFKDPVSHMCLVGAVVPYWFLTQDVTGSSPFNDNFLSLNSAASVKIFRIKLSNESILVARFGSFLTSQL